MDERTTKRGKRILIVTFLAFLLSHPAIASWKWRMYCGADYEALLPSEKNGPDFVTGVDFSALGRALRKDTEKKYHETKPVPFTLPDGTKYAMQIGRATTSEKILLHLLDGGHEVSTIIFNHAQGSSSAYLIHLETDADFRGRQANEALLRAMLETCPEVRTVRARLGWLNFKTIADALTGKDQSLQASAEGAIAQALAAGRRNQLARAVESSPTGKQMKTLGFVADPASLELHKATSVEDEDGPLLSVTWVRVGGH